MAETPCGQQSCHLLYGSEIAKNKKIVDALANACPLVLVNSSVIPVAQHIIEAFYPSTYLNSPGGFANLPQLWCFTNFAPDTTIQLSVFLSFHWLKMGYLTLKHCSVRIYNDEPHLLLSQVQLGTVQFSRVQLFAALWTTARQASLSITSSQSLLKLMSIESLMPSNHLILCRPLLLPLLYIK